MARPDRRKVLSAMGLALATSPISTRARAAVIEGGMPWTPDRTQPPQPVDPKGWRYFTQEEAEAVEALVDRLIPPDPETPGGKDIGCAVFIDRQLAGPYNMMGKMKFGFVNAYGIFLHDTPEKALFAKDKRNLSLGCIRLEHPEALAKWLLGHDPVAPSDDSEQNVRIGDAGVPIYVSYLTARPDGQTIAFADDVYKLDGPAPAAATATATASADK